MGRLGALLTAGQPKEKPVPIPVQTPLRLALRSLLDTIITEIPRTLPADVGQVLPVKTLRKLASDMLNRTSEDTLINGIRTASRLLAQLEDTLPPAVPVSDPAQLALVEREHELTSAGD